MVALLAWGGLPEAATPRRSAAIKAARLRALASAFPVRGLERENGVAQSDERQARPSRPLLLAILLIGKHTRRRTPLKSERENLTI
jgi:hypothetical protein